MENKTLNIENSGPLNDWLDNYLTSLNPYSIPRRLWDFIEPILSKKFQVKVFEVLPQEKMGEPFILWKIRKRTPGDNGYRSQTGPKSSANLNTTQDGLAVQEYVQYYTILYDWVVGASSSLVADELAWTLELLLQYANTILKAEHPGLTFMFAEQGEDHSFLYRAQDEIILRVITFKAVIPVRSIRTFPELKGISLERRLGLNYTDYLDTRATTSSVYYPPVETGEIILNISAISLYLNNEEEFLYLDVDYCVKTDDKVNGIYVEWKDELGRPPQVGENFKVYYTLGNREVQVFRNLN